MSKNPILCMILRITLDVNRKSIKPRTVSLPQLSYLLYVLIVVSPNGGCCFEVAERSFMNLMTAENLAVIFGPNLMWSKSQGSLVSLGYVNACSLLLISRYHDLFVKQSRLVSIYHYLIVSFACYIESLSTLCPKKWPQHSY